jgi:hypothetical protein
MQKIFDIREHMNVRLRVDFVNAFNHTNFQAPNATITNSSFGTITSAHPVRAIQLGMKFAF